jgi:hypothetical protein
VDVKEIRELAKKFTPEQIESCITQQLETGKNICVKNPSAEQTKIIDELSKAGFVKELMSEGMGLADALRELAKRMRTIQKEEEQ